MSWTAFGMSCLAAALAARTGRFDPACLDDLKADAASRGPEAMKALAAFERDLGRDPAAAGTALQDYVGRLAVRRAPHVAIEFDWQARADLR